MSRPADHQELDDLALRVLHGVADEAEQAALQELLRTEPAARHRFVLQATQHAMLCREGAAGSLAADKRLYFERLEEDDQSRWWARKAWLAAAAVAATLLVASLLLRPTDAMAALERVVQVAQETVTRCYSVRVLEAGPPEAPATGRGPYPPANHLEGATLWMKGPGEFVLRQGLPNGEIRLFGGDRAGSWTMRGLGPVKVSPDPTRFGRAIFAPSGEVAFLDLRTQLSRLKADYDVEWLDDESPDVRKLRAVRQRQAQGGPKEVELWFDPASGVIERLILRQLPRNHGGPRSLELVLLSSDPLPDAFFRHESHHEPDRPILLEP
jgi:hypothetical protein